ncbi:MAG: lysine-2,3-aminomutase-like protein [Hyphomicrobiaceae bacterium]|nr:lysine-2,3-aminomutase-like protein [Hyphomicrobiaceae bacterium]
MSPETAIPIDGPAEPVTTTLRSLADLVEAGLIPTQARAELEPVAARYAVGVSPGIAALIDRDVSDDPIARQFLPSVHELNRHPAERDDPIGDQDKSPVHGIVHRYPDRVLLKAVGVCPVYCRFCFRREMVGPGTGQTLDEAQLAAAVAYIAGHPQIWEVIVTGGDPLILSPRRIAELATRLARIDHVKVIRWHTRVPVVTPQTVTGELCAALASARQTVYVAVHANHPRELTPDARTAVARLIDAGVALVSQTVLLKGVNDDPDTLDALMRGFVELRIKPYYLHHPDLAPGTEHFRVPLARGQAIVAALRQRLSGLAMPTYVLDIPGAFGKVPVGAARIEGPEPDGSFTLEDAAGRLHRYLDAC